MSAIKTLLMTRSPIEKDIKQSPILFENVFVTFSFPTFFKQFLIHMTAPLLLWSTNAKNQEFLCSRPAEVFNYFFRPIFYVTCIIVALDDIYYDGYLHESGVLYTLLLFWVLQKIQIAIKYACLSKVEYDKFMNADYKTALTYNNQMMLVPGWLYRPKIVSTFELSAAAIRCGVDISTLNFIIPNPSKTKDRMSQFRNWKALLLGKTTVSDSDECPNLRLQVDGTYLVSVFHTCEGLLKYSESKHGSFVKSITRLSIFLSVCTVIIPILYLFIL